MVMITSHSSIDSDCLSFANADAILVCKPTLDPRIDSLLSGFHAGMYTIQAGTTSHLRALWECFWSAGGLFLPRESVQLVVPSRRIHMLRIRLAS